ncbi:MAG TPA: hypothetical protein VK152_13235 [Paludibacter sp.]|nr:hypothetical protein [Paludibacter sp.]
MNNNIKTSKNNCLPNFAFQISGMIFDEPWKHLDFQDAEAAGTAWNAGRKRFCHLLGFLLSFQQINCIFAKVKKTALESHAFFNIIFILPCLPF